MPNEPWCLPGSACFAMDHCGLIGLTDRVDALGGTIEATSPRGAGTTLLITLPVEES